MHRPGPTRHPPNLHHNQGVAGSIPATPTGVITTTLFMLLHLVTNSRPPASSDRTASRKRERGDGGACALAFRVSPTTETHEATRALNTSFGGHEVGPDTNERTPRAVVDRQRVGIVYRPPTDRTKSIRALAVTAL